MESRIIVKNIPKHLNEQKFKKHFESIGTVTDSKIMFKDGKSRLFGYIGFKENIAQKAVDYFNGTFIDTSKIVVELAVSFVDNKNRPWSKYSKGSSAFEKLHPVEKIIQPSQKEIKQQDPKVSEFLKTLEPRSTWKNDDFPDAAHVFQPSDTANCDPNSIKEDFVGDTVALDKTVSDLDYLKSKIVQPPIEHVKLHPSRLTMLQDNGAIADNVVNDIDNDQLEHTVEVVEQDEPNINLIADTGRIMVLNLPFSCTTDDLAELFGRFGNIAEVHIPISKQTKESRGFAFVTFVIPEHAINAYTELDNSIFQGRIIQVVPAKEKLEHSEPSGIKSFKSSREKQKKSMAGNDFNWNTLFMNSDAVASAIARKLNVQKGEIFDTSTDDMAVRLALAETSIINETKKYFSENGVCIESFMKRQTKSKNIILVKNITGKVEEDEIVVLFSQFGELGRVVLPPAKTICLVEFVHENDAKSAFKKLAYSKFKDLPLFLEWAAQDTFSESLDIEALEQKRKERDEEKRQKAEIVLSLQNDLNREAPIDHSEATAVLYVKNLNFTTTELLLKTTFQAAGNLRSVRIPMKVNPKTGAKQSMGFGFLDFGSKEDAMNCLKTMQNHSLEGHNLILKYSAPQNRIMPKDKESKVTESQETGTKLMIRNIPFEATKSDIKKLFTAHGKVKSVRLPTKFDGKHRGFAFVDFVTNHEARTAMESLGSTHLLGRHLVIEWAATETSVEDLMQNTAKKFLKDVRKRGRIEMEEQDEY